MVRHNIELCNKVAELVDLNIPLGFRYRTAHCLSRIFDAVESTSAECEEMVRHSESAQRRLVMAGKALAGFRCYFKVYRNLEAKRDLQRWERGRYKCALVHVTGSLFSMYRGYASTGDTEHVIAGIIGHCLKILLSLPDTRRGIGVHGAYGARKAYVDMCSVYEDIEQRIIPGLLLNPQVEIPLRNTALRYLSVMMDIWEERYGRHFDAVEQTGGLPSQPSTSGLGGAAGMVGSQASYIPSHDQGIMPYLYAQPSTSGLGGTTGTGRQQASCVPPYDPVMLPYSYAQPSTSGLGGAAGMGIQQDSYVPPHDPGMMPSAYAQPSTSGLGGTAGMGSQQASHIPPHDSGGMPYSYAQPLTSWDQPSTSGLGSTSAGMGSQQASHIPPHDPGIMPYSYAQPSTSYARPSTSGMGGTGVRMGHQQASYVPPHGPGMMPYSYAQPSTLYAQPSTSGLVGSASSELEEAQVSSHRPRTPSDDELEPSSKRARRA
ncbi:hypothetical protein ANAPRD1_01360 [Anaplasma phagocytophilum]|nr:hypothetical protein ANAPRD1_01360 [Anaplasma phagocytophilum]